ncbi:MAG: hypothetical protein H8E21_14455 [Gammaproteobacteria bacterium]|nr:hypothetical protein [Gammaproteobacteria bacterium]MBL7000378.1 hypothetical protein [Gammaproteobacteria bacterium]
MDEIQLDNIDLEQLVLRENIVSAVGLSSAQIQIGIKGDPSLRETATNRCRYESEIDRIFNDITPVFEDLLINRGLFRLFIGLNNSEVRTCSIFDPLREEIHDAAALVSPQYVKRHFPSIPYAEKTRIMRQLYSSLLKSDLYDYMPSHLQNVASKRHDGWQPMSETDIRKVLKHLHVMRNLPEYYLRNFSISIVQSVVRLQFNCDGTQIVHAKDFDNFVVENLP